MTGPGLVTEVIRADGVPGAGLGGIGTFGRGHDGPSLKREELSGRIEGGRTVDREDPGRD